MAANGAEDRALVKLAQRGAQSAGALRLKPEEIDRLAGAELVVAKPGRRGATLLEITIAGRQRAEAIARETPAPSPRGTRAALEARLERIESLLAQIVERLAPPPARPLEDVKQLVARTIAELDSARRYGGLVPIPEIRKELTGVSDAQVTAALEALEQDYAIDLNIAQQPTAVAERDAGIERPGRGLLYYVARRGA